MYLLKTNFVLSIIPINIVLKSVSTFLICQSKNIFLNFKKFVNNLLIQYHIFQYFLSTMIFLNPSLISYLIGIINSLVFHGNYTINNILMIMSLHL